MKILVVSNLYPPHSIGGYEERCRYITDRLRDRSHEIRVLTSHHGLDAPAIDEAGIHRRLRIHGFFGHPWLGISALRKLEAHNHAELRAAIDDFDPDVVHVWNLGGLSKSLILTLADINRPTVYDVSDHWIAQSLRADVWLRWWNDQSKSAPARLLANMLKATGARERLAQTTPFAQWEEIAFPRIYFCSDRLKQITAEAGWPVQHAAVIHCGVDTATFAPRAPSDRFTKLLWVGRLHDDKDPLTAIRALGLLTATGHADFTLDLYGRGEDDYVETLRAAIHEFGLEERVAFKSTDAAGMRQVYAEHDALLFTSAWEEPFALTPLEAMSAHLPVLSTLMGGSRELVRDGENAIAFNARDSASLADGIRRLADDADLRRQVAKTAGEEVAKHYDLAVIVDQVEVYLEDTLRDHASA